MMKSNKRDSQDDSPVNNETHKLHQFVYQDARQTCDFAALLKNLNEFSVSVGKKGARTGDHNNIRL